MPMQPALLQFPFSVSTEPAPLTCTRPPLWFTRLLTVIVPPVSACSVPELFTVVEDTEIDCPLVVAWIVVALLSVV